MLFIKSREEKVNNELTKLYSSWYKEVLAIEPELFGRNYSNPWYMAVPPKWFKSNDRILIVGEEGFGWDGNGKEDGIKPDEIRRLQEVNLSDWTYCIKTYQDGDHEFWQRAREVALLGVPCAYTFLNKVCFKRDRRSKLSDEYRKTIHNTSMKILAEEIRLIEPTVVFFFGWYGDALMAELPLVHQKLYPGGEGDSSMWLDSFASFEEGGIHYIFSYNPHSPYWKKKPVDYEEQLIKELKKHITVKEKDIKRAAQEFKYEPELRVDQRDKDLAAWKQAKEMQEASEIAKQQETVKQKGKPISTQKPKEKSEPQITKGQAFVGGFVAGIGINAAKRSKEKEKNQKQSLAEYAKEYNDKMNALYRNANRSANMVSNTYKLDRKVCATCAFWEGERVLDERNKCVRCPSYSGARCSKKFTSQNSPGSQCFSWKSM